MHKKYIRLDRTAGEQCQQVTLLGVASGARRELLCSSMAPCSTWLGGCGGDERAGGPGGHGRLSGGCGRVSSGPWSGRGVDSSGGNCGGSGGACVGGAAARREKPISKNGDADCVSRSVVGVGHLAGKGLAVGGTLRGAAGGAVAEGAAEGEAWVPLGVKGTAKARLVGSSEVVRVAHVVVPLRGCEPGGLEGSTGNPAVRSRCGSCFTCGSRLEEIPSRPKTLRHASTIML